MMMDDPPFVPDRALVARWRDASVPALRLLDRSAEPIVAEDAMMLAAYADGRLNEV